MLLSKCKWHSINLCDDNDDDDDDDDVVERNVLNDYIRHYEALTYDTNGLQHSHGRVRRSLDTSVRLGFHAHDQLVCS